jgi:hypothetical protein
LAKKEKTWLGWVAILTFPSFVFFVLYAFFIPGDLAKGVGLSPALALAAPGLFGASMTFAGLIVAVYASLKNVMTTRMRNIMWSLLALSLAGWLYVWISCSILLELPPFVPF